VKRRDLSLPSLSNKITFGTGQFGAKKSEIFGVALNPQENNFPPEQKIMGDFSACWHTRIHNNIRGDIPGRKPTDLI
jgi:hypothetical protein